MKFFPVSLVQKSVPEIRGIFIVESNLKKLKALRTYFIPSETAWHAAG